MIASEAKPFAQPWNSYRRVATQTAGPGQLILMLYDGAIRFLERALQGFGQDDPAEFHQTISNNVLRAQEITAMHPRIGGCQSGPFILGSG